MYKYLDPVDGNYKEFNCANTILYMTDLNMTMYASRMNQEFKNNFLFPQLLPGSLFCGMHEVSKQLLLMCANYDNLNIFILQIVCVTFGLVLLCTG
jgi:hypothetical protein